MAERIHANAYVKIPTSLSRPEAKGIEIHFRANCSPRVSLLPFLRNEAQCCEQSSNCEVMIIVVL